MAKAFTVGELVKWKNFYSKTIERGKIESIDHGKSLMFIWTGTFPNFGGSCKVTMSARRIHNRWFAYRAYKGYLERISRVKEFC